jgi:mannose-6-phosphate isomerase-like protein (cupin superfamily)
VNKVSLAEKLALINEYWRPKVVGELNDQEVKLVKLKGEFVWHLHENADEMFLVLAGTVRIELRDQTVDLSSGEMLVVPRGVEHRTLAEEEAHVLIFETARTRNTGNIYDERFTAPDGVPV